jgi:hypothetical protein
MEKKMNKKKLLQKKRPQPAHQKEGHTQKAAV